MDKRYQVFISSTFADLKEERAKVIQTIMELDYIPAGMEIFPAIDEEQFNFIKTIIDDCDYYILIVGGRYGTLSEDGLSYTEKEYDYAIEKGIKVIAFIHSNPGALPLEKSEKDSNLREKREVFKVKVSTNRLIKHWTSAEELPGLVALSLSKTIKTYPAVGWIRANLVTNVESLQELNEQRKENQELKLKIQKLEQLYEVENIKTNYAELSDKITISGEGQSSFGYDEWKVKISWKEIFLIISPQLYEHPNDSKLKTILSTELNNKSKTSVLNPKITLNSFNTIKIHLEALGLISSSYSKTTNGGMALFWSLTDKGKKLMYELLSVKKVNPQPKI